MRITVYGNLIYDQLVILDSALIPGESHHCTFKTAGGGILNFCRALVEHDSVGSDARRRGWSSQYDIDITVVSHIGRDAYGRLLCDELTKLDVEFQVDTDCNKSSFASVIVDKVNNVRTGLVEWGDVLQLVGYEAVPADWHHIMYLDRIQLSLGELLKMDGIRSADFCTIDDIEQHTSLLHHLDYLIVSDRADGLLNEFFKDRLWVRKGVIIHSPTKLQFITAGGMTYRYIKPEPNLNVVGAGDYFAAFAVANLLKANPTQSLDLNLIHTLTLEQLRKQS
jgi:sugar/nucleoside kinase (ribokinase family)